MIDRGCFNYRWPFNEYSLFFNEDKEDQKDTEEEKKHNMSDNKDIGQNANKAQKDLNDQKNQKNYEDQKCEDHDVIKLKIAGTCVMFSFVKDGILYQVIRVEEGSSQDSVPCRPFPSESQIVLTIGGPLWFQSFASSDRLNGRPLNPKGDVRDVSSPNCLRILDTLRAIGMEARVYQLCPESPCRKRPGEFYKQLDLVESPLEVDSGAEFGETYTYHIPAYNAFARLPSKQERRDATFLATIRLREASGLRDWLEIKSRDWLEKGGLEKDWPGEIVPPGDWPEKDWPGVWPEESWPDPPTSEEIYDYVGVSPFSPHATGPMWETAFLERERKTDSSSELAEVRLIGRCIEKILQVDLVPEENCPERVALVSNIFHWPNIDLKAML
jgi:hypothetical protein